MNNLPANRTYLFVTGALLVLLGLTVAAAYANLGPFNVVAALAISMAKGALIVLIFMNVRRSNRLIWLAAGTGFFWLAIMFALAMADFAARS
jgi:cytochrome c oxidase subunit 4